MDLLNHDDCVEIIREAYNLNNSNEVNLIEYTINSPLEGTVVGFLGEYFKLKTTFNIDNSQTEERIFFVKAFPKSNDEQKKLMEDLDLFKKEVFFYTIAKDLKKYTPLKWHADCYYHKKLLVFEDLSDDYRHLKDDEKLVTNIKPILKCLAALHASSIIHEAKTGINIGIEFEEYLQENAVLKDNVFFQSSLTSIENMISNYPKYKDFNVKNGKFIEKLNPIYDLIKVSETFQNALCHRDLWEKNFFYKFDKNNSTAVETVLVDFQMVRYHPPAIDVLSLIYVNTRKKDRDLNLEDWLKYYYDSLREIINENGLDINKFLSWNDFRKSCDYIRLFPLTIAAAYTPMTSLPKDFIKTIRSKHPDDIYTYFMDNRDKLIMEHINISDEYRDHVYELHEELADYVFESKQD